MKSKPKRPPILLQFLAHRERGRVRLGTFAFLTQRDQEELSLKRETVSLTLQNFRPQKRN